MSKEDIDRQSNPVLSESNKLVEYLLRGYYVCLWWSMFPSLYIASSVITASLLLSVFSWQVVVTTFVITFSIYNLNNIYDSDEDEINVPRKAAFVRDHKRGIYGLVIVAYLTGFGISFFGGPYAPLVALVPLFAGVVYSIDSIRAKGIIVVNTMIVTGALAVTVVGLPLAFQHRFPIVPSLLIFVCFLLKFAGTTELCNITDIEGDRRAGISTLPVVFGVHRTKVILYSLETIAFTLIVVGVVYALVPIEALLVFAPTTLYSFGCIYITEPEPPISKPAVYGDFQLLLMGMLALVVL